MDDVFDTEDAPVERTRVKARQTRDAEKRPVKWMPPQLLPDPHPEEGYAFRWIRISTLGADDAMNISGKFREGWEPVKASDHPEVEVPGALTGRFKDCIVVGGLMLCKTPKEFVEQRDEFYRTQARSQMTSVENNFMRQNDPRMPLFREHSTSFGKSKT